LEILDRFIDGVLVHSSDGDLLISTKDRAVGRQIFVDGRFDGVYLDRLLEILDQLKLPWRGREFLDVGANIGTTSPWREQRPRNERTRHTTRIVRHCRQHRRR
jgi:hypothetical protein